MNRRTFMKRTGQAATVLLAFPAVSSAETSETLEQRVKHLAEDVAPLRSWSFGPLDERTWGFTAGWEPTGEIIGQIPRDDESVVTIMSLVLPVKLRDTGVPLKLYQAWGGRVRAAFPSRQYTFLD